MQLGTRCTTTIGRGATLQLLRATDLEDGGAAPAGVIVVASFIDGCAARRRRDERAQEGTLYSTAIARHPEDTLSACRSNTRLGQRTVANGHVDVIVLAQLPAPRDPTIARLKRDWKASNHAKRTAGDVLRDVRRPQSCPRFLVDVRGRENDLQHGCGPQKIPASALSCPSLNRVAPFKRNSSAIHRQASSIRRSASRVFARSGASDRVVPLPSF